MYNNSPSLIGCLVLLSACSQSYNRPIVDVSTLPPIPISSPAAESLRIYTLEDIAKHSTPDNCWFAIHDKVYDVTLFVIAAHHPGGDAILEGCGKDATALFETRPMGSGTAHSNEAQDILESLYIGNLIK